MSFLPTAKSSRWYIWFPVYALLLWLLLILHRFVLLDKEFSALLLGRYAALALGVSIIVNGFGWLGARLVWLITTAGILIGLGLMIVYTYREMSGWEDLAGFLTFAMFTLGGFAAGLLTEGIYWLARRSRSA
ncbi:hypothetical protein [Paenibacillus sp. P46E]|uniref:hypothetical protein n=1 Tax=Paenibacillus sp. P46E TaxID=1349436 RepID=UPI00093C4367|nr:hypothetical protein [Paenibacillus sp. P46E]OKP97359.1 hypothetical protein A3849_15930 [Paenibacillus sp. P46E]